MDKSERLNILIKHLNISQRNFAEKIKTNERLLSNYTNGLKSFGDKFAVRVNRAFNVSIDWLMEGKGEMFVEQKSDIAAEGKYIEIPIYANVQAGSPVSQWSDDGIKKTVPVENLYKFKNAFAVTAKGDSMSPYINSGDILICADKPEDLKDGKAVVTVFHSIDSIEASVKLYRSISDKQFELYSVNSKYKPVIYNYKEAVKIYKVVQIIRDVK